jgi:quinohemoprotein ethanol dehydrogenase
MIKLMLHLIMLTARTIAACVQLAAASAAAGTDWAYYEASDSETHYSSLTAISAGNVKRLGLAWSLDLPGERTLEAPPLAVAGVLYFSGTYGKTYAVDARTGRLLWTFDPDLASHAPEKLRLVMGAHRGVAYWRGKVYVGVVDGRLLALDAATGKPLWTAQTFEEPEARQAISGAPRVFGDNVVIGFGGAEYGTRGYVSAYGANTGELRWRFYTVPSDPERGFENRAMRLAADTWHGPWWQWGGGGTVWDSITYDPALDRIYLGTGNGGPWDRQVRSPGGGDNLFLSSIVALDARSGAYEWHYQATPGDEWDFDATQNMVLADLRIRGRMRKVLMQANKNGFFYVIDRAAGTLLSADAFTKVTWAKRVDAATGRPVESPQARYVKAGSVVMWPAVAGGHNFQPMSFNPATGLVYIPTMKLAMRIGPQIPEDRDGLAWNQRHDFPVLAVSAELASIDPDDGTAGLLAWDPVARAKRWEVHYAHTFWNGGTLTTAGGLVFQGLGSGELVAYDATSGRRVWRFSCGLGIVAAPSTYELDGVQYLAILVGYGGSAGNGGRLFDMGWRFGEQPRRLLVFALDRHASLPPTAPPRFELRALDDAALSIDASLAAKGRGLYHSTCTFCHGGNLQGTGSIAPDLRESQVALHWLSFESVVKTGVPSAGMPRYDDLTEADVRALFMYVRAGAREALREK